jgi:hypothetical protein
VLISYPTYQISKLNAPFFLESTPPGKAAAYLDLLRQRGVPDSAMTFPHDHSDD